jgi:hypothetical protein
LLKFVRASGKHKHAHIPLSSNRAILGCCGLHGVCSCPGRHGKAGQNRGGVWREDLYVPLYISVDTFGRPGKSFMDLICELGNLKVFSATWCLVFCKQLLILGMF